MNLVRLEATDGTPLGSINWFPVHPTSMNNTNRLISGDNKGYAAMLFESEMNPRDRPGKGSFVSAFGAANLGDVSPNINGEFDGFTNYIHEVKIIRIFVCQWFA
jgi:neutral ceramidase